MKTPARVYYLLGAIVLLLAGWAAFFHFFPPERLIESFGVKNIYLVTFLLAVIGGFSSLTGTSLYATLIAFSHGGASPLVLGIVGGIGFFLSDSLFYFVADYGKTMIVRTAKKWEALFDRVQKWVRRAPDRMVYAAVFLYAAFLPLPNDILLTVLVVSNYSYRQFAPYLFLGDLVGIMLIAYVGRAFFG